MRLLRIRDLRIVLLAYGLSAFGDYLALIALTLRIKDLTESGLAVSALLVAGILPIVVLGPLAGHVVDRLEPTRVLTFGALIQAGLAFALVFAEEPWLIVTLFFLLSTGFALSQPGIFAMTPWIVGEDHTTEANAYLEVSRWAGAAIGPIVAGVISHTWGSDAALLLNALTFLAVGLAMPLLRVRRATDATPPATPERARDGVVFIGRDPILRVVVVAITLMVVFSAIDNVAEVFFAKDVLEAGDLGYSGLVTAWTLGMVIGATGIGRRLTTDRLGPAVVVAGIVGGGAIALAAGIPMLPLALGAFVVGGAANGVELVGLRSLIHARVPDRLRGRAFAAYYAAVNAAQITALGVGGGLVGAIGPRASLLVGGMGTLLVGAAGFFFLLRARAAVARAGYSTSVS
ncbi:MAG TPA: MFS transporter [Actinomycetota bacterium]